MTLKSDCKIGGKWQKFTVIIKKYFFIHERFIPIIVKLVELDLKIFPFVKKIELQAPFCILKKGVIWHFE